MCIISQDTFPTEVKRWLDLTYLIAGRVLLPGDSRGYKGIRSLDNPGLPANR